VLLERNPHLVIDGALLAAEIVGAKRVILAVSRDGSASQTLELALADRRERGRDHVEVVSVPARFVAGEESALVHS
jgi:NADH:ubiquinone oxidoreductase subunit F (NADH-binding)